MNAIAKPTVPTCGNCTHGHVAHDREGKVSFQLKLCHGVPPTPVVMIIQHPATGAVVSQLEMSTPVVKADRPPCSLWKLRSALEPAALEGTA